MGRTRTVDEIYPLALDALAAGLGVGRASILLFDADGVMRFKAYRQLSDTYRRAVEGHTPWSPDSVDPEPIVVPDVTQDASLASFLPVFQAEGIAAMAFIPLVSLGSVIGKFMLYFDAPRALDDEALELAGLIASQVAFAVARTRAEEQARRSEARLRFALDAALMGTWDWDLATNHVEWSENLPRIHGLPDGSFDGTFASYEREIHPDDRARVLASAQRAVAQGVPHDVEYRIVAPDGAIRWVEGKGLVHYEQGRPARMSGVCMVVTRRKEAELARLTAAEEASRLKDEFLATLSHELRTPLNAILGWVQMLKAGGLTPRDAEQAIDVIGRNARLQAHLIEDILDVSRIITGKLEIDHDIVPLGQVLDAVLAGILPAAGAKRIAVSKDVPEDLPPIEGDRKRLQQIFGNVLSNALKFTPEGGTIAIRATAGPDTVELVVRDSGSGIAPEFLPYVFDRFRQADSRSTRRHGGLGLGLAIARHLMQLHGGIIAAESEGVGRGTTITFRLPIWAGRRTAATIVVPAEGEVMPDCRLDGIRIVVVDDQPDSRDLLETVLKQHGADVVACARADAALRALGGQDVQLLVADIAMPDMDGWDLIERVRELPHKVPAIAVSAYARPQDRARALSGGFAGYCAKPLEVAELLRLVKATLKTPVAPERAG
ncbi:MAG: ATP-binding protein [Acidobacteriota bacterium]